MLRPSRVSSHEKVNDIFFSSGLSGVDLLRRATIRERARFRRNLFDPLPDVVTRRTARPARSSVRPALAESKKNFRRSRPNYHRRVTFRTHAPDGSRPRRRHLFFFVFLLFFNDVKYTSTDPRGRRPTRLGSRYGRELIAAAAAACVISNYRGFNSTSSYGFFLRSAEVARRFGISRARERVAA